LPGRIYVLTKCAQIICWRPHQLSLVSFFNRVRFTGLRKVYEYIRKIINLFGLNFIVTRPIIT
jgi:hypothetical protein